jgi:uncharacterized protein YxeA
MKKLMSILMVLLLVLASSTTIVMAQSGEGEETQQQQDRTEQVDTGEKERQPAADVSDTFTPSEEISEDLSVSFPVDI